MNEQLLKTIEQGQLTLFLGAGASFGCQTSAGQPVPMSGDLAKKLADESGLSYADDPLDAVYEAARGVLGNRLDPILEREFKHVTPSMEYGIVSKYVWRRIYTLNIDDGLDRALNRNSPQNVSRVSAKDPVIERDVFFKKLEYIKLNGTADRLQDGVIFSASEYAKATASHLPWYSQCASDFVRTPILFIGTQLNEPLLKYHIERYQTLNPEPLGVSFLIARSATPIQIAALKRYKIEFIAGTLSDFAKWLVDALPKPPSPDALAIENIPQLKALLASSKSENFASLFECVTVVRRDSIFSSAANSGSAIRDFYKGFKPTWGDIVDSIPAKLEILDLAMSRVERVNNLTGPRLLPVIGPAGSGKSTLLMQVAWEISHLKSWSVYFLHSQPHSLLDTLLAIEQTSPTPKVLVALDNIEFSTESIFFALKSGRLTKTVLLGAERESSWSKRGQHVLSEFYHPPLYVRDFSAEDAQRLLERLKLYGSWTRLGQMRPNQRLHELVDRSKKQLLIALMEATLGRGFEQIIESEYSDISTPDERLFLVTISIITDRRCDAPVSLIDRALDKMSILRRSSAFAVDLAGIVHEIGGKLFARHPVYAKYLVERVIDPSIAAVAINGLLQAFADYKAPVIQNIPRDEATLYKSLINHKFLYEILKGHESRVLQIYKDLEKKFESDGLFWLQYGLALRDFGDHPGALEKLRIASSAYAMPHTLHALAQQLLLSAEQSDISAIALGLAEEAKQILDKLDDVIDSDDTYPLVTLAEGYTSVLRKHVSEEEARSAARRYALVLESRARKNPQHSRLQISYERMFKFASVGMWFD